MRSLGCIPSTLLGNELEVKFTNHYLGDYTLSRIDEVKDQGDKPICVSNCIREMVAWKCKNYNRTCNLEMDTIFNNCPSASSNGLVPKVALELLISSDFKSRYNIATTTYGLVKTIPSIKYSISQLGPVMVVLPVKSSLDHFWNGTSTQGYHAVIAVGYNKDSLILKNSWGRSFGDCGFINLPYSDFDRIVEAWVLMN